MNQNDWLALIICREKNIPSSSVLPAVVKEFNRSALFWFIA